MRDMFCRSIIGGVVFIVVSQCTAQPDLLISAKQLERSSRFDEAVRVCAKISENDPRAQEAAVVAATCLAKSGRHSESIAVYERSIEMNKSPYRTAYAMYAVAKAYDRVGDREAVRRAVARLAEAYPESHWNAEASVVLDKCEGRNCASNTKLAKLEQEAHTAYSTALNTRESRGTTEAMCQLNFVLTKYPNTAVSLQARESLGNLLADSGQTTEAQHVFTAILEQLGDSRSSCRLAQMCRVRLGALNLREYKHEDAYGYFVSALLTDADSDLTKWAALQGAGAYFEVLQRDVWSQREVTHEQWEELRKMCAHAKAVSDTSSSAAARAELMSIESYRWEGDLDSVVSSATAFLKGCGQQEDCLLREIATTRLLLGHALLGKKDYEGALRELRWVTGKYADQDEIWPGMDHLPKAYCRIWETLFRSNASRAELQAAAEELESRFPNSPYNEYIRLVAANPPAYH